MQTYALTINVTVRANDADEARETGGTLASQIPLLATGNSALIDDADFHGEVLIDG